MTSNARIAINNVEIARQNVLATIATAVGEDPENIFSLIEAIDELSELRTTLLRTLSQCTTSRAQRRSASGRPANV